MPNSFVSVRATEGQTTFPFSFPNGYLSEDHIRTYVDGTEVSRTISGGTAIIAPVASGQEVVVARQSPQTPYIAFEDGSILNKQNIDTQNRHAFMLAEEAAEQRDFFALGDIDMNYHKIIHVAPGEDQYDVVNKGQFDYFLQINEDAAQRAEDAADAAAVSAQQAASSASAALASQTAADASADSAANTVAGFDAHAEAKKAEVTAEGDEQVARVIAEGDAQYGRAKTQADRAQGYAEILERPYEDRGAHQIQQGYPPVPSFSSMWMVIDGGLDPVDGVTMWNVGDILLYSVQATAWSRMSGAILGGGGDPLPVEILDDLIMQQGKKIRFRVDEFVDIVGMTLDGDGDLVVGELPETPSTGVPAPKMGLAATELYHLTGTDASGAAVKHKILTEQTGVKKSGDTMTGPLKVTELYSPATNEWYVRSAAENSDGIYWGNGSQWSRILAEAGLLQVSDGTSIWRVYHQGFRPTAADVGAVNKAGDTMTGNLTVPKVLLSAGQGSEGNALTRKDYVDGAVNGRALASHTHTAANGNQDIVASGYGQVGTYAFAARISNSSTATGGTRAGSDLAPSTSAGDPGSTGQGTFTGTWKCLGACWSGNQDLGSTLWIRIA